MKKRKKQHELKGDVVIATQKGLSHVQNFYKIFFLIEIWRYASTIGTNNLVGIGAIFNSVERCFFCADTFNTVYITLLPAIGNGTTQQNNEKESHVKTMISLIKDTFGLIFGLVVAIELGFVATGNISISTKNELLGLIAEVIYRFLSTALLKMFLPALCAAMALLRKKEGNKLGKRLFCYGEGLKRLKRDDAKYLILRHIVHAQSLEKIHNNMAISLSGAVKLIRYHHDLHRQALFEQRAYFFCRNLWTE
jgi:hypothetical protein